MPKSRIVTLTLALLQYRVMDDRERRRASRKTQILLGTILLIGLALAGIAHSVLGRASGKAQAHLFEGNVRERLARARPTGNLDAELERIARSASGTNGIMVRSVDDGLSGGFRGATLFPQGSLRRLWLGAALLEAVDVGELSLDQKVRLESSPHRSEQVSTLLRRAVVANDLGAQDELLAGLNGPAAMDGWLVNQGLAEVSFGPSNRDLARSSPKGSKYARATDATPDGLAFAASKLAAGRLLSPRSSELLLGMFGNVRPQTYGLGPGWEIQRLSGEAVGAGRPAAASAIAIVRSPGGETFVLVVMTKGAPGAVERRDRLLFEVLAALAKPSVRERSGQGRTSR